MAPCQRLVELTGGTFSADVLEQIVGHIRDCQICSPPTEAEEKPQTEETAETAGPEEATDTPSGEAPTAEGDQGPETPPGQ